MRLLTIASLLLIVLAACGVPDPAAPATPTPTISPTIHAGATPTLVAPTATPPKPSATPTRTTSAFNALPLDQLLFQPGNLPDGVTAGTIERDIPRWAQDKMIPAPESYAALGFLQPSRPNRYGQVAVFFAATSAGVDAAYGWLGGRMQLSKARRSPTSATGPF